MFKDSLTKSLDCFGVVTILTAALPVFGVVSADSPWHLILILPTYLMLLMTLLVWSFIVIGLLAHFLRPR